MMKLLITYPGPAAEKDILRMYDDGTIHSSVEQVCSTEDIVKCREEISAVRVDESICDYIITIVEFTRRAHVVSIGSSPRGSIATLLCAKTSAAINGRDYVIPDDVRDLALPVLRHRIILRPEAEIDGVKTDEVIENILTQVKVPR
jgi:MoxR-like ATPase